MNQFLKLFKKVGGKDILAQWWHSGILPFCCMLVILLGVKRKSLEIVRLAASNRRLQKMRKKYSNFISDFKNYYNSSLPRNRSNKVWVLWLQGMDSAPELVKKCYESLQQNLDNQEIILLTEKNYQNYVEVPKHIQEKITSGIITRTHFSDLLRLELLSKYGGTWIDATVYCSGKEIPKFILNSDLFVYQCLKPGLDGHCTSASSWLMTSCTNNPIIVLTKTLLYEYWARNNHMTDYFLIHDFFQLSTEAFPIEWKKVIPFSNSTPHILLLRLFEPFHEETWTAIKQQTCFHKLSYKFDHSQTDLKGTYFQKVFK